MAVRFHSIRGGGIFWPRGTITLCAVRDTTKKSARSIDRAGWHCKSMKPNALHDAPEIRIDFTAHGRFNPAAFDADVAERAVVQFVQRLDDRCRGARGRPVRSASGWPGGAQDS